MNARPLGKASGKPTAWLKPRHGTPTFAAMQWREHVRQWRNAPPVRFGLLALGCVLMIAAPIVSPLPGPGGIILFAAGLGLALRNSLWAKRRYVRFKRKRPQIGRTVDWWMRKRARQRARPRR